jgi:hypothetical protein
MTNFCFITKRLRKYIWELADKDIIVVKQTNIQAKNILKFGEKQTPKSYNFKQDEYKENPFRRYIIAEVKRKKENPKD